jgi:hypothetical protein
LIVLLSYKLWRHLWQVRTFQFSSWIHLELVILKYLLQSNRMFSCEQHCNVVPQYCSFDRQIALSNLQPTRTNCKLKFTKDL